MIPGKYYVLLRDVKLFPKGKRGLDPKEKTSLNPGKILFFCKYTTIKHFRLTDIIAWNALEFLDGNNFLYMIYESNSLEHEKNFVLLEEDYETNEQII